MQAGKFFDKLCTSEEYLRECDRAARGEIHIEQMIVVRKGGHQWRIIGRELQPRPVGKSAFTEQQSVFNYGSIHNPRNTEGPKPPLASDEEGGIGKPR